MESARASVLAYRTRNFYAQRLQEAGVPVTVIPKLGKADPLYPLRLARWLHRNAVDIVHAFLPMPVMWSYLALRLVPSRRRPVFIPSERNTLQGISAIQMGLRRFIYPRAELITANARSVAREISEKLGVDPERVAYIPNGIDSAYWKRAAQKEPDVEIDHTCFNLAMIARFAPQKNHRVVLEALSMLPRDEILAWRVWFVGNEEFPGLARSIRREIHLRGLEPIVRVLPPMRNVGALLSRMDGLLLPSGREGFPNVVLEAMTLGLPVVASGVGDVPEMIAPGRTGFIVKPGDAGELARAMAALRDMPESERRTMGIKAQEVVESRYTISGVTSRHVELYRSVLEPRSRTQESRVTG